MPQLNPMIPLDTPKGEGFAFWRTDYSQEHDTLYTVIITATREIWEFPTPQVRGVKNISMGRTKEPTAFAKETLAEWSKDQMTLWINPAGEKIYSSRNPDDMVPSPRIGAGPWRKA